MNRAGPVRLRCFPAVRSPWGWAGVLLWLASCAACSGPTKDAPASKSSSPAAAPAPVSVTTAPVTRRAVRRTVTAVGTLHGFEEITITPKVEGRVQRILCEVGDRIAPQTLLLEIDPTDHQLAVDEAQRGLELELAKLGSQGLPSENFDIETLPAVQRAQLVLENSKKRFDRQRSLVAKNVATQEVFEQTEMELKVAEANLRQNRLDAQATLAAVRHRLAVLELARQRLSETRVVAPQFTAGPELGPEPLDYVVAQRMVSVGEMVRAFPSTPVMKLVLDRVLKMRVRVPERYVSQVHVDQAVEVRVEAWRDEIFPARVVRVSPTIDPLSRTFEVEAIVPNADRRLKAGSFAKAEIITSEASEALTVPLESLVRFAGVNKVFCIRDQAAHEVLVEVGGRGPGWFEVQGPLTADDTVVTTGHGQLSDGRRVVVKAPPAPTPPAE